MKLIGPFKQILTLANLPLRGKLSDEQLEIIPDGGILVENGKILKTGVFSILHSEYPDIETEKIEGEQVALPAFTDSHTHICFGGNRANDFAMRNAGKSYLEIAESGGGIWSSVQHTRDASEEMLLNTLMQRIEFLVSLGITTIEIKSGYGLDKDNELKMLRIIKKAQQKTDATLVPTCLSAHLKPRDYNGSNEEYLNYIFTEILPEVKKESLAERVDIFIEKSAFQPEESRDFLLKTKGLGFEITVHADQFTPGSSRIAVEVGAKSADHLEATVEEDIAYLAQSDTVATALPGASLGLGEKFTPARKLLDAGAILAIASDWNPGSAPMGNLIVQASILATYEKLTTAEVLAGITFRSAYALGLEDRGRLLEGKKADFITFATHNFQNILYYQGSLKPEKVFIGGNEVKNR
ncbi:MULTISPECIES: imidazolonepropionase [Chryseobacterium]|uniref:Imidazolonepropionase n=1 Tax=Chryseobacterium camelliae TaxID=1265445 RepID=A0ABU0TL14_9FLAO|nr:MULTISPECIES: imidazolonepropionase [Chryseobacterium]MDT3408407.1 imidazolonepropionase [Pseudacidovorax intermedius]MDQ1097737.1 imidazolonepropionase [Chryseobacterium camelliae]MDQ1101669.1 imidazolonepropionase [Chryseobacterium sp. SORGH_AS_1048]MDR6085109.1 imidazolonepropionase [Chryseobacterium sp. SORGH_AS_0909]MDR6129465.1 imidazolonepropionase [Chryseobacterium sp. SORGH_AS_1175]